MKIPSFVCLFRLCLFLCAWAPAVLNAQTAALLRVDSIHIEGNRRTRTEVILRELDFAVGDTLSLDSLSDRIIDNRLRILNLGLFSNASLRVAAAGEPGHAVVIIVVYEGWYWNPLPVFELADRNFNVWWRDFDHSLKRVNYGLNVTRSNFTGHGDVLRVDADFGFTNRYVAEYASPAFNRELTLGMLAGLLFSRSHEVALVTEGNTPVFRRDVGVWQIRRWQAHAGFVFRPRHFVYHDLELEYHRNLVIDTISGHLNPDFFLEGRNVQEHFSTVFHVVTDHRDIKPYPTRGYLGKVEVRWNGLFPSDDLHLGRLRLEWRQYKPLGKRFIGEVRAVGRVSFPHRKPPYFNNQALGYGGDFVRGYEYYVADGLHYGLLKTSLHTELFNRTLNLYRFIPFKSYRQLELKVYASAFSDLGYARDPFYAEGNPLSNRPLWGYGIGLDVEFMYNKVFRVEWSWNDLGQNGIFFRIDSGM